MSNAQTDASQAKTWIYKGPELAVPGTNVWHVIADGISPPLEKLCLKCDGVTLTRKQLLDTVDRLIDLMPPRNSKCWRVGINLSRSAASVIATLALWKSGSVYVPLAIEYPTPRIADIAENCDLDLIISDKPLALNRYYIFPPRWFLNQRLYFLVRKRDVSGSPDRSGDSNICYIAHTSGSTGSPKGVAISHRALINRMASMARVLCVSESDVCIYKTALSFDVHIWEFVLPMACGSLLVIHPQSDYIDVFSMAELIIAERVTIVGFVPSLLNLVLDIEPLIKNNMLRAVLCGGEAWGPSLAKKFYSKLPGRKLYNSYGPTESTIAVANWPVPATNVDKIYLGLPLDNLLFMIEETDKVGSPSSENIIGLLSVGGAQVGEGYINAEQGSSFFWQVVDGKRVKFYRTGDSVMLDPHTGLASFVGRDDNQVKIHGMRMELEEIEAVISRIDKVERCVVVVIRSGPTPRLHASFTSVDNVHLSSEILKDECQRVLPRTFVPFRFKQVREFPLTTNGKIDRAAVLSSIDED
jgi:amino acid adenylation domain-containing protein